LHSTLIRTGFNWIFRFCYYLTEINEPMAQVGGRWRQAVPFALRRPETMKVDRIYRIFQDFMN
jgi:hypothetical protein